MTVPQPDHSLRRRIAALLTVLLLLILCATWTWKYLAPQSSSYLPKPGSTTAPEIAHQTCVLDMHTSPNEPLFLAFDGHTLTAGGLAGSRLIFKSWDATTLQQLHQTQLDYLPDGTHGLLAISPDGTRVALGGKNATSAIIDLNTGQSKSFRIPVSQTIIAATFTPDGTQFFAVRAGGTRPDGINGWDIASGSDAGDVGANGLNDTIRVVAGSVNPNHIVFGGVNGSTGDLSELQKSGRMSVCMFFRGQYPPITAAAYSADGTKVISGHEQGQAIVWNDQNMKLSRRLTPHLPAGNSGHVSAVALSPHGSIAAMAVDNLLLVFDVSSGKEIARLSGHVGRITALLFLADARHLATAADDGTVRLWELP